MSNNYINQIICKDVKEGLKGIPDNTVHLTFTSPPYNVNLDYDNANDKRTHEDYLEWLKSIFQDIYRTTVKGGRCAINIDAMASHFNDRSDEYIKAIYPHLYNIMKEIGWKFRTEICWYKQNAVGRKTAWGSYASSSNPFIRRVHEYVLVWSKEDWKLESEEKSDITKREFEDWTLSTWFIKPQTMNLSNHPAPFPEELAKRVIKMFSFPQQVILDPFSGTGTCPLVAYKYNRKYIGIDNSEKYCKFAINRINKTKQEDLLLSTLEEPNDRLTKKDIKNRKEKKISNDTENMSKYV